MRFYLSPFLCLFLFIYKADTLSIDTGYFVRARVCDVVKKKKKSFFYRMNFFYLLI